MYKIVRIKYKSIMVNDEDKNSVNFHANGTIHEIDDSVNIYFETKEMNYEISFKEDVLTLKQGKSELIFKQGAYIDNDYQTPYGSLVLTSYLDLFEMNEENLKIKYRLFQNGECISKIYMHLLWMYQV